MLKLYCVIVNGVFRGNCFSVEVSESGKVLDLVKVIINAKAEQLGRAEADDLRLVLAKNGDGWLDWADAIQVPLKQVPLNDCQHPQGFEAMNPFLPLKDDKYLGGDFQTGNGKVHVLVVVPESLLGETTSATTTGEMLGKRQRTQVTVDPIDSLNELVAITEMAARLNPGTDLAVGNLLNIPESPLGRFPTGLYVRKEYWDLHKMIKQRLEAKKNGIYRVLVIGSPGIGKSVFGVFVLLVSMMEKKNVAYRPLGDLEPYYFSWNGTKYVISEAPLPGKKYLGLFDNDDTGGAFRSTKFHPAYVFASPHPKNYNHFVKEGCLKVYMNPWTRTECQGIADALHLDVQVKNKWLRRYDLVGGKPRIWVSLSRTYESLVQQVKADIPRDIDDLKRMIHLFRQGDFDERTRHNLFSICRDGDDPSRSYLVYSSLAVEAMICARYDLRSADQVRSLLQPPRREYGE